MSGDGEIVKLQGKVATVPVHHPAGRPGHLTLDLELDTGRIVFCVAAGDLEPPVKGAEIVVEGAFWHLDHGPFTIKRVLGTGQR